MPTPLKQIVINISNDPKRRRRVLEGLALIFFVGVAWNLMSDSVRPIEDPAAGGKHYAAEATPTPAALRAMSADMASGLSMKAASSVAPAPEAPAGGGGRHVEEHHNFQFQVAREMVREHYDTASGLCEAAFCEMVTGNLHKSANTTRANITIRIDRAQFPEYIAELKGMGSDIELVSHQRSARDRTMEFQDLDARRNSKVALRARLERLVTSYQGDNIRALLDIERELARVQGEIESMEARLRGIRLVTERVTVNISFFNEAIAGPDREIPYISNAMKESKQLFARSTADVIRGAASGAPVLLGLLVLALVVKFTFGRLLFRSRKKS